MAKHTEEPEGPDLAPPPAECAPCRQTAVSALRERGEGMIRGGRQLLALARTLEQIRESATAGCEGEGRHPYLGVGSDAEEALWALVTSYRG